ncbi:MAG: ABC transporter permease [Thermoleophilia bacterium]
MSSSSNPERPGPERGGGGSGAQLDLGEVEQAEAFLAEQPPTVEKALGEGTVGLRKSAWGTLAWATPGAAWLGFFLLAPLTFIVLVSFWTYEQGAKSGFRVEWTLSNYSSILHDSVYWNNMLTSFQTSLIAVAACLVFGFPVAYFLALKVQTLKWQIGLFILALAPFWTSFLTRSIAWTFPLMGREGALNKALTSLGIVDEPIAALGCSTLSVRLAMVQLYILFMITPLFFTLSQVDRSALEAARDLGGNWLRTFKEVILPQAAPGAVIGSIFVFVLTMGDYSTTRVIGCNKIASVGTIVNSNVELAVNYPRGAASAVLLVLALIAGVFVITRFSNLREEL